MTRTMGLVVALGLLAVPSGAHAQTKTKTTVGGSSSYTVKKGDTLWGIARRNKVPLARLEAANPQIADFDRIFPGDRVSLPGPGAMNVPSYEDLLGSLTFALDTPWARLRLSGGKLEVGFVDPITKQVFSRITIPIVKKSPTSIVPSLRTADVTTAVHEAGHVLDTKPTPPPLPAGYQTAVDNGWARVKTYDDRYEVERMDPMTGRVASIDVLYFDQLRASSVASVTTATRPRIVTTTTPTPVPTTTRTAPTQTVPQTSPKWNPFVMALLRKTFIKYARRDFTPLEAGSIASVFGAFRLAGLVKSGAPPSGAIVFCSGGVVIANGNGTAVAPGGEVMDSARPLSAFGSVMGWVSQ